MKTHSEQQLDQMQQEYKRLQLNRHGITYAQFIAAPDWYRQHYDIADIALRREKRASV
tara:strand:- start:35 stop:208 length:174 start_codon:yes stop_codon:yes gene_type:complete